MFSQRWTTDSTVPCWDPIDRLKRTLDRAEAVVVGAGSGLSSSAGLTYSGERFQRYFSDFIAAYHIPDMYSGGFWPYASQEEYWAWWSRQVMVNRFQKAPLPVYEDLLALLEGKDYFVLTTNVDHQFRLAGFPTQRLFCTQGDYGLWQCSQPCHPKTYDNEAAVRRMAAEQRDLRIPAALLPCCPLCGRPMAMNLRCDETFVQDDGWYRAQSRCRDFLRRREGGRVLFLELGVGGNTPAIIKYPFWRMTAQNPEAVYACVNFGQAHAPEKIASQSICLDRDIGEVLRALRGRPASSTCGTACGPPPAATAPSGQ